MSKFPQFHRSLALALFLGSALVLPAQLTVILAQNFDVPGDPWVTTGSLTLLYPGGDIIQDSAGIAPIAGNTYSGNFANNATQNVYAWGVDGFAGIGAGLGYGVELWVKNPGTGPVNLVSFGEPGADGIALILSDSKYYGSVAGAGDIGAGVSPGGSGSIGGWDHLAMVTDAGTATFYVNAQVQGSFSGSIYDPTDAWHIYVSPGGGDKYVGLADNLTFFTFATGTFNASQLEYASAVPEPASYALLCGAVGLALACGGRKRLRAV